MAPLVESILTRFGTQEAILVTASFSFACCVSGLLMKPLPSSQTTTEAEEKQPLLEIDSGRASSISSSSR